MGYGGKKLFCKFRGFKQLAVVCALSITAGVAGAETVLNLATSPVGTVLSAGDGLFSHGDKLKHTNPTPILTTQDDMGSDGAVDAFNALKGTGNPVDTIYAGGGGSDGKTHPIAVADLKMTVDGKYYVFLFDGNQAKDAGDEFINFTSLMVYTSTSGSLLSYANLTDTTLATLIYDMDAGVDYTLRIDGNVGSGGADMYFYLPTSLNWGTGYVYLSEIYTNWNDGPDAWILADGPYKNPYDVPEPGSLALLGLGLAGLAAARRRNK